MPHSTHHTHTPASSAAASVAYGMGSTIPHASPSLSPSSASSSPSPLSSSKSAAKPKYYSDFADLPSPHVPPPNRGANLDISRFASFERKAESLAYTEQLLLDWLRDQARYTLPPDVNLAELNLASRILYRLTAIQKTMLSIDAILVAQRNNQPVPPIDDDPLPPLDSDPDPEPAYTLGARASTPATPLPVTSSLTPSANPLGSRTASSASESSAGILPASSPLPLTNPAPACSNTTEPCAFPSDDDVPTDSPSPHSALRAPHCPSASVHACPTLPIARLERALALNESDLSRLTGTAIPPSNPSTDDMPSGGTCDPVTPASALHSVPTPSVIPLARSATPPNASVVKDSAPPAPQPSFVPG